MVNQLLLSIKLEIGRQCQHWHLFSLVCWVVVMIDLPWLKSLHAMLIHTAPQVSSSIRLTTQNAVPSMCHCCHDRDENRKSGGEPARERVLQHSRTHNINCNHSVFQARKYTLAHAINQSAQFDIQGYPEVCVRAREK